MDRARCEARERTDVCRSRAAESRKDKCVQRKGGMVARQERFILEKAAARPKPKTTVVTHKMSETVNIAFSKIRRVLAGAAVRPGGGGSSSPRGSLFTE